VPSPCASASGSRFGAGLSTGAVLGAAEAAAAQAVSALPGAPDLVCAFVAGGSTDEHAAALQRVGAVTGARTVVGSSAAGVLGGDRGVASGPAVSVLAAVLPGARLQPFHLECLPADSGTAVVGLPEPQDGDVALLLADPYSFPAAGFAARSSAAMPGLALIGGLVGAGTGPGITRLHVDGRTVDRGAVGLLLGGTGATPLVSQGCRPIGPAMTVTAAAGNVVRSLAGEPALRRIEHLLADLPPLEQALASTGLHLGIVVDEYADEPEFLVRPVLGSEAVSGGLVIGDLVETGSTVRLQVRDAEAAGADLARCLERYASTTGQPGVGGALLFSCTGRGTQLFGSSHHDPAAVSERLGTPAVAGLFAAGELGPVAGRNALHALTATVLAFPGFHT